MKLNMKHIGVAPWTAVAMLSLTFITGCKKDQFDPDIYNKVLASVYPVDSIDTTHTWSLNKQFTLQVNTAIADTQLPQRIQLLSGNPYADDDVEILSERFVNGKSTVSMKCYAPNVLSDMFVAAVTSDGRYFVVPLEQGQTDVDFSDATSEGTLNSPEYTAYTYLYEANFPAPDDFDYNDVVLRIREWAESNTVIKVEVTIDAVGTNKQVAGAIRLPGIKWSMVNSVTIDEGNRFDEDYPFQRIYIVGTSSQKAARNGDVVINMFEDAHWSLQRHLQSEGTMLHVPLNTTHQPEPLQSDTVAVQTRTYTVTLVDGADASTLSLAMLDPFIIEQYNTKQFEVHPYQYKFEESLWQYYGYRQADYDNHMSWAIVIPSGTFRYPTEGVPLCTNRSGVIAGAYMTNGHSFGEWCTDCTRSVDWWLYPGMQVY